LTAAQAHDDGPMIPKDPAKAGARNEAGETVNVREAINPWHADIVTDFRSIAISFLSEVSRGNRALKDENYPLKNAKSLFVFSEPKN
jgi:hypothetical protein